MSERIPGVEDIRQALRHDGWTLDEADDGIERIERRGMAVAWGEGHARGWSDAQDAHDVRQVMDRPDWPQRTPNPYREEGGR